MEIRCAYGVCYAHNCEVPGVSGKLLRRLRTPNLKGLRIKRRKIGSRSGWLLLHHAEQQLAAPKRRPVMDIIMCTHKHADKRRYYPRTGQKTSKQQEPLVTDHHNARTNVVSSTFRHRIDLCICQDPFATEAAQLVRSRFIRKLPQKKREGGGPHAQKRKKKNDLKTADNRARRAPAPRDQVGHRRQTGPYPKRDSRKMRCMTKEERNGANHFFAEVGGEM